MSEPTEREWLEGGSERDHLDGTTDRASSVPPTPERSEVWRCWVAATYDKGVGCGPETRHDDRCRWVPRPSVPSGSEPVDPAQPDGAALIAAERQRQISAEGWTPDHDAEHTIGELVDAAVCYLRHSLDAESPVIWPWPWDESWWKPSDDSIRNLVRAGALVTAEIDRLQRAAAAREDHR